MLELRQSNRTSSTTSAVIRNEDASLTVPCVVQDLSEGGAKLSFDDATPPPNEFILYLRPSSPIGWKCRVIWRTDKNVGVHFVSIFDSDKYASRGSGFVGMGLAARRWT
jgi:hypothetical protein